MKSQALSDRIIRALGQRGYTPRTAADLAERLRISEEELGDFHAACKALMRTGRVAMGSRNTLMLPDPPGEVVGVFRANPAGFGFVIPQTPNSHGDLYIAEGATQGAVSGDTVKARVRKRGRRGGRMIFEGEIVEVLRRGHQHFVGELREEGGRTVVVPDGQVLHGPILVRDAGAKNARSGDQVVVELTEYPAPGRQARGVIVRVLGERGRPEVDLQSILVQYALPGEFPPAVLEEARRVIAGYDEAAHRRSRQVLKDLTIITIDPPDARDFDDAISLTPLAGGKVELGVHIADVSAFVREGGALDAEARARANSVYFPRHVIPMLPEVLSNGLCSLQEAEWRLTKSAFITYDADGAVVSARFANTMIRSAKRLTYLEAQAALDGRPGRLPRKVVDLLKRMDDLARRIRARRLAEGMIVLDLPEVELVLDDKGAAKDVAPVDTSFTHTIIEMFMVEANEAVCRLFTELHVPHLRRVHDEPSISAQESLSRFVRVLGHNLPRHPDRSDMQRLLDEVRGGDHAFPVHFAALRSMQRAEYSPQIVGHFALASEHYTHFTSPIRRYPDLTIHRLLDLHLAGRLKAAVRGGTCPDVEDLAELGAHCSLRERQAEAAERELRLVKILRLLESHVGRKIGGIVTGVAQFGLFLQVDTYLIDGLLRLEDVGDDWWDVDTKYGCIVGQRSGKRITIGDRLEATIARIDLPKRTLELALRPRDERRPQDKGRPRNTNRPRDTSRPRDAGLPREDGQPRIEGGERNIAPGRRGRGRGRTLITSNGDRRRGTGRGKRRGRR